ncbi:MAG: hypothetical protein WC575_02985 [Patescibacteria group bacterium]
MDIESTALITFILGIVIYFGTALFVGTKKANWLPGGAIGAAIFWSPLYISIPASLLGHLVAVYIAKKMKK